MIICECTKNLESFGATKSLANLNVVNMFFLYPNRVTTPGVLMIRVKDVKAWCSFEVSSVANCVGFTAQICGNRVLRRPIF